MSALVGARSVCLVMGRRFRHYFFRGAASALVAYATPAFADPVEDATDLPGWMQRAQQRLALTSSQRRDVRELVELNTSRLAALQRRQELQALGEQGLVPHDELAAIQHEFRAGLSASLSPVQLAAWDRLLEELSGEVALRNAVVLARRQH